MAEEELKKEIIEAPKLPTTVQGDGRYLMTLLNEFLRSATMQINLANGFSAEEIKPEAGKYPTPRNFFLTFNRSGGILTWDHLADVSNLAYYELRTDTSVGTQLGLLERTIENRSTKLPVTYVGHIYLYAVSKDKEVSAPSEINYTKARPDAPTDIAITPNSEGSLITFLEIPTNCIGANIYIGGEKFQTVSNVYLYKGSGEIEKIEVAYYDQFGEGEHGVLYLILPDVTGLLVERNGPELDFYWDPVNVYGVSYVVKVCQMPDWKKAVELFRTKTNDKNRYIYPNTGEYYLLVKAVDEHGNYSKSAAYQLMNTEVDISRNVILKFDQRESGYSGTKINVYYDAGLGGITLEREASYGEYLMDIQLDQKYRARNWVEYNVLSLSGGDLIWDDADFSWDEADLAWAGVIGNTDGVVVTQQIAYYKGLNSGAVFAAQLTGDLLTDDDKEPIKAQHADDFRLGRWAQGLYIGQLTELEYSLVNMPKEFHMVFILKVDKPLEDTILMTLANAASFLMLGYSARLGEFYLRGSDGVETRLTGEVDKNRDWLTFGISQGAEKRRLYIHSLAKTKHVMAESDAVPIGNFTELYAYPKLFTRGDEDNAN